MVKEKKVIYYSDELNDEFAGVSKPDIDIAEDFVFINKNILWRILSFIAYRIIMKPFAFIYCKLKFHLKVVDNTTKKMKGGCFLYCNHTLLAGDAFIPNVLRYFKKVYVIVNPENIASKGTKNFILMNGAIPIPKALKPFKNFLKAIERRLLEGNMITIYPEAHIWPYYTKIRHFKSVSFKFPVKFNAPVFVSTTTFQKKKLGKKPRVTVYLEGPFYADKNLSAKQATDMLCEKVYKTMLKNSKNSTYEHIIYKKGDNK